MSSNVTTRALQALREEITHLKEMFTDDSREWHTLHLAYEALRCAQVACGREDTAAISNATDVVADALKDVQNLTRAELVGSDSQLKHATDQEAL